MTEDFDEEVVFENSPLFQYLQDLGHTDFEACSPVSQEELNAGGEERPFPQDILPPARKAGIWRLVDALYSLSPLHRDCATHLQEQQLDAAFRQYSLRCLLSQDVLLQEDVELIELLDPSVLSLGSTDTVCPSASIALPAPRYVSPPSIWDVSVLVGLLAILLAVRCSYPDHDHALWVCVVLLCVVCVYRGLCLWHKAGLQRHVQSLAVQLEGLVNNSRALTSLSRKSLRLIQETEVILRGFTLLLDRVSGACPFNRVGQLRSQQLIGLRKVAYQCLRCTFRASRLATCIMLKSFPLNSEIDNVTNYVSTVPIRELGLGLGVEHLSDEQAQELTNDYSLPALKMLFQLWVGQSSEFFRRLALLLSPGREELNSRSSPLTFNSVPLITDSLHRTLAGCLGDLQRSYDFHRYFEMQHQSLCSGRNGRAQQKCRELNSLHTSVRSLQLHLKTLLNEVIILEDDLEKLMVAKETEEMTCAGYQELRERLHLLQPHMQASTCCWDDTLAQVDRMLRRVSSCPESSDQLVETAATEPPPPAPITHIQDRDPIPEEQELEAYVSDSDSEMEQRRTSGMLSSWEQEHQQHEREESRCVLLELKSVLGIRTSDGERDKRKRLLFSDQAALALFDKETSEPDTNILELSVSSEPTTAASNHIAQPSQEGLIADEEKENDSRKQTENISPDLEVKYSVVEFCTGDSVVNGATIDISGAGTVEEAQLFQSDGLIDDGQDGTHSLTPRVPTLSVTDRLIELHGSDALTFSSALAAQVAARSHSFAHMQECTYGDSEEEVTSPQKREIEED
ncbi:vezatin-like isoform X1 [Xyrauchen texanus]|uniref:vezatin-like isoform X1 n=1 Tax=Xyrauchen texanus TaxID=154827 RepID=UPI002241EA4F|nr:vezatin-like isoform X1 [Xyrauchen texanus]